MMLMGAVGINKASATSFNLPFFDDLNYSSISAMVSAGWTQCGSAPQSYYSVGNSLLTLENDGSVASLMCWSNIPAGVTSWTVSLSGQYAQQLPAGGWTGGGTWLSLTTPAHSYGWDLDGYYKSYYLFRDGVKVSAIGGYTPQLGAWHTLTLDMNNGVLSAIADGNVITTYAEAGGTNNALTMVEAQPGWETVNNFDYASITFRGSPNFDFSISSSPTSANVVKGDTVISTISVSLTLGSAPTATLSQSGCPPSATCSFNPSSGTPSYTSVLTVATTGSTPMGTYTITVSGTAGALTRTTTFSVTVTPSLGDLWSYTGSGAAYFERQSYSIDSSVVEVAPFQYDSNTIYMYYRTQVNDVCILGVCQQGSIGLARSFDGGLTFSLYNGGAPVVSAGSIGSCDWDSLYVVAPSVVKVNGVYYMVYEGQRYDSCIPSYGSTGDIGLATSSDGLTWQKRGIVLYHGLGFESANIGTPSVEYFNGQFYVFYHGFDGTQSHIGYAYGSSQCTPAGSTNCTLSLQKYCCNPVMDIGKGIGAWDSAVNSRASIIWDAASGYYYMSYEGSQSIGGGCGGGNWGWGIARSTNLNSWEKYLFNPIRQTYKGGCGNDIPYIFKFNGQIYVYQREYGQRNILTSGSDKYLTVYLAVNNGQGQCELWSHEGRKDGDGWAANTAQDSQGHMCYGPYVTSLPNGKYWVNFREMIDNNNADASWVINEEIYDDTTPSSVVLHHVSRTDFVNTYQNFYLQFPDTSPHSYEFRTWYYAIAYIRQYMVSVRQIG